MAISVQVVGWPLPLFSGHVDPPESPEQEFVLQLQAWKSDTGRQRLGWLRGFDQHLYQTMELHDGQTIFLNLTCLCLPESLLFVLRILLQNLNKNDTFKIVCLNKCWLNLLDFWLKRSESWNSELKIIFICQHLSGSVQRHLWPVCWVWRRGGAGSVPCVSSPAALSSETPESQHQRWRNGQFWSPDWLL